MVYLLKYEYLFLLPLLLSAIFSLRSFGQKWPKPYKWLTVLVVLSLLTEILAILWKWYLYRMFGFNYSENNLWIYNIFITIRFAILLVIFYRLVQAPRAKKVILCGGSLLVLIGIINYAVVQGPFQYNTYTVIFAHVPIIALCLYYFKQLLEAPGTIRLQQEPFVWMTLGIFIYHVASLPFLVMLGFLNIEQPGLSLLYLPINDTLNFLLCSFYLICFLCKPQQPQYL